MEPGSIAERGVQYWHGDSGLMNLLTAGGLLVIWDSLILDLVNPVVRSAPSDPNLIWKAVLYITAVNFGSNYFSSSRGGVLVDGFRCGWWVCSSTTSIKEGRLPLLVNRLYWSINCGWSVELIQDDHLYRSNLILTFSELGGLDGTISSISNCCSLMVEKKEWVD